MTNWILVAIVLAATPVELFEESVRLGGLKTIRIYFSDNAKLPRSIDLERLKDIATLKIQSLGWRVHDSDCTEEHCLDIAMGIDCTVPESEISACTIRLEAWRYLSIERTGMHALWRTLAASIGKKDPSPPDSAVIPIQVDGALVTFITTRSRFTEDRVAERMAWPLDQFLVRLNRANPKEK